MKNKTVTVLIADDHPVVRSGIRQVLSMIPQYQTVHEANDGTAAIEYIRRSKPDVAILDIEMPGLDGFEVAEIVRSEEYPVRLIFMTMHNDEQTFNKAMDLGINGFVLKENAVSDIVDAVRSVMEGKYYLSPTLSDYLVRRNTPPAHSLKTTTGIDTLTPSERNILRLIAEQKTTKTIAEELFISPKTVDKHRANICAKLDLHGAYALLKFAFENKNRI
jgi:DNA-binding NarL/FixJ family response regulator